MGGWGGGSGGGGGVITFLRKVSTISSENRSHKLRLRKTCEKACPSIGKGDDWVPEVVKTQAQQAPKISKTLNPKV